MKALRFILTLLIPALALAQVTPGGFPSRPRFSGVGIQAAPSSGTWESDCAVIRGNGYLGFTTDGSLLVGSPGGCGIGAGIFANLYYNGGWHYIANGGGAGIFVLPNEVGFEEAPTGTAGAPVTTKSFPFVGANNGGAASLEIVAGQASGTNGSSCTLSLTVGGAASCTAVGVNDVQVSFTAFPTGIVACVAQNNNGSFNYGVTCAINSSTVIQLIANAGGGTVSNMSFIVIGY